jgi:uncharacterized UPF0146 family protein
VAGRYRSAVEVGFGGLADVALALQERGLRIAAADIRTFAHEGLETFTDDITAPDLSLYQGFQVLYAIRPPLELVSYIRRVTLAVSADMIIKPLSSEYPGGCVMGRGLGVFFIGH